MSVSSPFLLAALQEFLVFDFQFVQNLAHLFVGSDAGGHQRQTQAVLDHAHHVQHGFHSCRVTVNEKQLEQLGKLVVDGQGACVVSGQSQTCHATEFTRKGIPDYRDDSHSSQSDQGECDSVVTGNDIKVLMMSSIWVMFPEASLMATMLSKSRARRRVVSAVMFTPVRPGTL